eukprot:5790192-Ditylum_brightwellii.AAC.1
MSLQIHTTRCIEDVKASCIDSYHDQNNGFAVIKTMGLDANIMTDFLRTVGQCCNLTTIWEVIYNKQDLLEGV